MKPTLLTLLLTAACSTAMAHPWSAGDEKAENREALRAYILEDWRREHGQVASGASTLRLAAAAVANAAEAPATAKAFLPFTRLDLRGDNQYLYVGSNGMPDHGMMVGITAWQQQVPLPQNYFGDNAWRIPLKPVPAKTPAMIDGRFLRGAVALAVNGIPIFNPQNNRGEISYEIGELDQWGGHCGRADDYHYHITPLHLQAQAGKGMPVAYALDGYPIFGITEPDGSPVGKLDECHGHETAAGYHYHGSMKRPYIMAGFHGEVVEEEGQVSPQPRASSVRPALPALRGAVITGFESVGKDGYKLTYTVGGEKRSIAYTLNADGSYPFTFDNGREGVVRETYAAGGQGQREGRMPRENEAPPPSPQGNAVSMDGVAPSQPRSSDGKFVLSSPVMEDGAEMPTEHTGDGAGTTPPLVWKGVPMGTRSYALIMDHADRDGNMKWYWTLYDIPVTQNALPKNAQGIGKAGSSFRGQTGYEPPHSKGPGTKTYVITLYALSAPLKVRESAGEVNREVLLAAMQGKVLAISSLRVTHTTGTASAEAKPTPPQEKTAGPKGGGKPKGGPPGLVKPSLADTLKLNVYADNWFMLYVNGRVVAVDSIPFTPHNVVSVDFLPEYPMTIAVLAKDNADPKTGMEYGTSIGDGGLVLKFADGTVTNATWKAKSFFHGPIGGDTASPKVRQEPLPANWWAVEFDDRGWAQAREYSVEQMDPKQPYFDNDFTGAKFIWTDDLALDNTVVFRTRVEKPGWTPRWNTKPDLDVKGAPLQ